MYNQTQALNDCLWMQPIFSGVELKGRSVSMLSVTNMIRVDC